MAGVNIRFVNTPPAWKHYTPEDEGQYPEQEPYFWSNVAPLPERDSTVNVTMNSLGAGRVAGYFVASGFLGLMVSLSDPPTWYVKQNGGNKWARVFGAEIAVKT